MRTLQVALLGMMMACFGAACGGDDTEPTTTGDGTTMSDAASGEDDASETPEGGEDSAVEESADDAAAEGGQEDSGDEPAVCVPACEGKTCGSDGCGGSCGTCTEPASCVSDNCCTPECTDMVCGDDGCGGSCGECASGEQCSQGLCEAKTYTCPEMFSLAQASECDWSGDFAGCQSEIVDAYAAASDVEAASLAALLTCLDEKGCAVTQSNSQASCQKDDCLAETVSCEASQNGELMCFEITQCMQEASCPKSLTTGAPTAACRRQCLEQGSAAAVEFWVNLDLCGVSECLGEADYDQCVTDVSGLQCVTEYSDCYDEAQQ